MKKMLVALALGVVLVPAGVAQDTTFDKTKYSSAKQNKEVAVDLTVTDTQLSIKGKKGAAMDIVVPYSSVDSMSYEFAKRHRVAEGAVVMVASLGIGAVVMATKTTSHWLAVEYHDGTGKQQAVLQLDKSNYKDVIATLEARSGMKIAVLDTKKSESNPTAGSKDVDELVPFGIDQVSAAMTPAMMSVGCEIVKSDTAHIECKRPRGGDERNGYGGESVTARLEREGDKTHLRISTGEGFVGRYGKKNWSASVYQELMKSLQSPPAATVPAAL